MFFPFIEILNKIYPALAAYPDYNGSFLLGNDSQKTFDTFIWSGVDWSSGIILARFARIGVAILLSLFAALFFDRFDPSPSKPMRIKNTASPSGPQPAPVSKPLPAVHLTPLSAASNRFGFFDVFLAELKLLLKGQRYPSLPRPRMDMACPPSEQAGGFTRLLAWIAGALFIPSLALALGVLTGSSKTFEVVYVSWMYLVIQSAVPFDFVGMTPESPRHAYAPLAMLLLGLAFIIRQRQLAAKTVSR